MNEKYLFDLCIKLCILLCISHVLVKQILSLTSSPENFIVLQSVTGGQCSPAFIVLNLKRVKCVGMAQEDPVLCYFSIFLLLNIISLILK